MKRNESENLEFLFQGILTLSNVDECRAFFEDLCTTTELKEMARRLHAAKMLSENHVYNTVAEQTGLSTATISRVNQCLKFGDGGYHTVLENLERLSRRK